MTDRHRSWLPWEIAEQAVARAAVTQIVEEWATEWFAAKPFGAAEWRAARGAVPTLVDAAGEWIRRGAGVALHLPSNTLAELVGLALQLDPQSIDTTDSDQQLQQAFGRRMMQDLAERFDQRIAPDGGLETAGQGHLELTLAQQDSRQIMRLYLPFAALVALHRAARPLKAGNVPLTAMTTALADTPVPVRAFLGSATVNLEDLRGLSAGDTLVLSTLLADGIAVAAGRTDAVFASAELLQEDQRLVLRLNP